MTVDHQRCHHCLGGAARTFRRFAVEHIEKFALRLLTDHPGRLSKFIPDNAVEDKRERVIRILEKPQIEIDLLQWFGWNGTFRTIFSDGLNDQVEVKWAGHNQKEAIDRNEQNGKIVLSDDFLPTLMTFSSVENRRTTSLTDFDDDDQTAR